MPLQGAGDRVLHNANGTTIVRAGAATSPWLVTWLPDDPSDPAYPGFTMSSTLGEVPPGPTVEHVAEWAGRQPWAKRGTTPENVERLDVPTQEWSELQKEAFENHVRLAFTKEPDGRFSWGLYSDDGVLMQHGVADTWDDARLAMIENLYPRSEEN